jgi:hypothetical protein
MRKLTASILATAALAGGAFTGVALAAPAASHSSAEQAASLDRNSAKQRDPVRDRSRHESASRDRRHESGNRDRMSWAKEHVEMRDR